MNNLLPQPLYEPRSTHTPHHTQTSSERGGTVLNTKSCGGHSTGETPSNIPNLEAKPGSADGTATDRLWESRTPPQHTPTGAARNRKVSGRSLYSHTRTQTQRTHTRRTTNPFTLPRSCGETSSLMMEQLPGPCGTSWDLCPNQYRFVPLLHSHNPRRLFH